MPDIDSISVAFPVKSMRGAEHFVMNATEEEARRGFAKVVSDFGELLDKVNNVLSISSARSKALRGARRIRKKSYAKVFRASVRAETSRLPVCGSAARRNRRLG